MAVPENIVTNHDIEKMVETSDDWIWTRTGIRERRVAGPTELNSDFAAKAGKMALENAKISPEQIDLVLLATVTEDKICPATANYVQTKLGIPNAASFDLNGACSGFIYSLLTAEGLIQSGACKHVLVIGSEIMSRILDWEDRNTCVLFGDGAGAVVLGEVESGRGILSRYMRSDGRLADLLHVPGGGTNMRPTHEVIDRKDHLLKMSGNEVFKNAVRFMGESAEIAIAQAGLTKEQIDLMIPHQANVRIIESTAKRIDLPMAKVFVNIDRYGNTTAASIPIALYEALQEKRIGSGSNVLLVAFGAGFTWGSAVVRL